jgi:hypothetical protein
MEATAFERWFGHGDDWFFDGIDRSSRGGGDSIGR